MSLTKKTIITLRNEGLGGFLRKSKGYISYHLKTKNKNSREVKDILFINGCTLPHPARYRVIHQIEQLEANGLTADEIFYEDLDLSSLKYYRGFVFFRCPVTSVVDDFIEKAQYFNKTVFFDIDDLVIDRKYTDEIKFVKEMNASDRRLYDDGVARMSETMKKCDYLITTTDALARELKQYGKEVFINRNVASEEMVRLSLNASKKNRRNSERVVIGYLSGSITHNPDFELIKPALIKIMDEYENVDLLMMGYLDLPEDLMRFKERIIQKPFSDWHVLPRIIAGIDINLAPIEKTIFNEAKSENKWTEASLCEVVTVASDYGAFHDVIKDGETGILCKNNNDWYKSIKQLIENKDLRERIGNNAKREVLKKYVTTYSGTELAKFIESKLAKNLAFVLPSTNISGGVNVVLKHCDILRRNGWDVMVINMDVSDDNIESEDGEINVVSGVKHEILARFYEMVATLYTTLKYIKQYPEVKKRCYLVQNFETDFNDFGNPMRKEANATYNDFSGIEYLTISEWCKEWLIKDFGKEAKYVQNGIDLDLFQMKNRTFNDKKIKVLVEGNSDDYYKNVDESFRVVEKLPKDKYEILYLSYQGEPKKWYHVDKFYHKVSHDDVAKVYTEADILIKSSLLESFSYPPLEMMATGGFAVVAPNAGNVEYLKDGVNCLMYKQGDVDDAVNKIIKISSDKALRKKLMVGAKETVKHRNWKDLEKSIVDLYK